MSYDKGTDTSSVEEKSGQLVLGDVLPSYSDEHNGEHLFVSLSELIMENVFYHPAFECVREELDTIEASSIDAILGDSTVTEHFVATLVTSIQQGIQPNHKAIRVMLNGADSYAMKALLGGKVEASEINPLMGLRGVSRFACNIHSQAFALECSVIKALRELGHNVEIVIPFVRALSDAAKIIDKLAEQGLPRGLNGLKVLYSCDVPSSVLLAERLLQYFDGLAINVDNLTQFTLGVDRLNESLEHLYDPQNESVLMLLDAAIASAHNAKKPVILVCASLKDYPLLETHLLDKGKLEIAVTA
jgi:pyruvate,water dikinase